MNEEEQEEVPEVSDADELLSSYARIKALLSGFENESSEWSSALYDELNDPIKANLLNRLNVHDRDAEFFSVLRNVDHAPDRSSEFEYGQDLLDPFKLDNELDALLNSVDIAKVKSISRAEKLHAGFRKVKAAQQLVVGKIVRKLKTEAGLTRIETKVREHQELIDQLQTSLAEKKQTIVTNNREKELSADELRHKHEGEIEEKIRGMVQSIEVKTKELSAVTSTHGRLKSEYSNLQGRLGTLLQELDVEEKAATMDALAPVNPVMRFRASIYRNAASKGTTTNLFGDVSSGTITKELVSDSQRALTEAFEKQQQLYAATTASEERTQALRKELTALLQSEENKALDRLKKVCDNLQVKILSDEQRVKVMATLVHQIQKGDQSVQRSAPKELRSSGRDTTTNRKSVVDASTRKRARSAKAPKNSASSGPGARDAASTTTKGLEPAPPELMDLVPDPHEKNREPISMKLHRRLHAQYYEVPVEDEHKESSSESDNDNEEKRVAAAEIKAAKSADLPRKRRITPAQSGKIQKIMDMLNMQFEKLSTVKEADIKHILDYRAFPDDANGLQASQSGSHSEASGRSEGSARSRRRHYQQQQQQQQAEQGETDSAMAGEMSADHTKMFQSTDAAPGLASESTHKRHGVLAPRPPGVSRASSRGKDGKDAGMVTSGSDDHLRIPVTADLEDRDDAEFYAQNFGIKMALEHLTAFLEVLTSGNSTDASFLSNQAGKARVTFARDEKEELLTVEDLRGHIAKLISLIRELHFLSQSNKQIRKGLQKEVDSKLKECDRLRNDLLQEIEGSHWPQATKAGQYEIGIEQSKDNLRDLKATAKEWDQRVSIKRAQTIRLSQIVANTSTRRASVVHKLDPQSEEILRLRKKSGSPAARSKSPSKPKSPTKAGANAMPIAKAEPVEEKPLVIEGGRVPGVEYKYTVANKRMSLFDDISNIYDTAITSIKSAERSAPHEPSSTGARPATEPRAWDFAAVVHTEAPLGETAPPPRAVAGSVELERPLHRPHHPEPARLVSPPAALVLSNREESDGVMPAMVVSTGTAAAMEPDSASTHYDHGIKNNNNNLNSNNEGCGEDEDAASDGWEEIPHGYEGDKSDADLE